MEHLPPDATPPTEANELKPEDRTMGMLVHLSALLGYVFPFGNIIAPLVIWLIKKDESEFINDQGKEAVNFQITIAILAVVCFILIFVIIGILLLPLLGLVNLILVIVAAVKANSGERYRYPFAIRLIH